WVLGEFGAHTRQCVGDGVLAQPGGDSQVGRFGGMLVERCQGLMSPVGCQAHVDPVGGDIDTVYGLASGADAGVIAVQPGVGLTESGVEPSRQCGYALRFVPGHVAVLLRRWGYPVLSREPATFSICGY